MDNLLLVSCIKLYELVLSSTKTGSTNVHCSGLDPEVDLQPGQVWTTVWPSARPTLSPSPLGTVLYVQESLSNSYFIFKKWKRSHQNDMQSLVCALHHDYLVT